MAMTTLLEKAQKKISASFADPGNRVADPSASAVPPPEQRRFPRFSNDFRISMLSAANRPADEAVRLVDMSAGGVGIECRHQLAVGQTLGFRMTTRDGTPVEARAKVRWAREMGPYYNYGLELEGIGIFGRFRLGRSLRPDAFGVVEMLTLALEAGASIIAVLIVADFLKSDPVLAQTLFFCMPVMLLFGLGFFTAWLLKN